MRAQEGIGYISKEFQTGLRTRAHGLVALDRLRRLQDDVGRRLHLVATGGIQYLDEIVRSFEHFTFVTSTPAQKANFRSVATRLPDGRLAWLRHRTRTGRPIDALFKTNVNVYLAYIRDRVSAVSNGTRQMEFPIGDLRTPRRRAAYALTTSAACPRCKVVGELASDFGVRLVNGKQVRQSWCKNCRRSRRDKRFSPVVDSKPNEN